MSVQPPIEAILFDLDNTIVNRQQAFELYIDRFVERFVDAAAHQDAASITEYIRQADRNGYRKKRELYEELFRELKMKHADTTVQQLLDYWFATFSECTVLMEDATEVLTELRARGFKLGLITNGSVRSQCAKIDQVSLRPFFDTIIVSDEVEVKKPDRRIFELALEQLGASARYSWYVGDHPVNDIQGAAAAGLQTVWLSGTTLWTDCAAIPAHTIHKLRDLLTLIEEYE